MFKLKFLSSLDFKVHWHITGDIAKVLLKEIHVLNKKDPTVTRKNKNVYSNYM